MKYVAKRGDTWDSIAYKAFGDEFAFEAIHRANVRNFAGIVEFEGGELLEIPDELNETVTLITAPWGE